MSRIGKMPVPIPAGVAVTIGEEHIEVNGPKGRLATPVCPELEYSLTKEAIVITRRNDERFARSQHGLRRTLLNNCIVGVTQGFAKTLEIVGVGFRVSVKGQSVELTLGFSHPVLFDLPAGISAKAEGHKLTVSGADKEMVGETAARIRRLRKPEPYKGKGIKYETEKVRRKVGKSGGKK